MRLGYLLTQNDQIKEIIEKHLPIWNINSLAERFIELFPQYNNHYNLSIECIIQDREKIFSSLNQIDLINPVKSHANFLLCKITNSLTSQELCERLYEQGFFIKDCSNKSSLGNKFVRIAVRKENENKKLLLITKQESTNALAW